MDSGSKSCVLWVCCESCYCFVRNLRRCLWSHAVVVELSLAVLWWFCLSRFVFWLLIDLPPMTAGVCCCFCFCCWLWHCYHLPDPNPHTHMLNATSPILQICQHTAAMPQRLDCDCANFIVILQNEHLRVPHSGAARWPLIHLADLFIMCNTCSI